MKVFKTFFLVATIIISLSSCEQDPFEEVQGFYCVDKPNLLKIMQDEANTENVIAQNLLKKAAENAIIDIKINGDSLSGLFFLAGQSTRLSSQLSFINDTIVMTSEKGESILIPNEKGVVWKNRNAKMRIQLIKSHTNDFSKETKEAIQMIVSKKGLNN